MRNVVKKISLKFENERWNVEQLGSLTVVPVHHPHYDAFEGRKFVDDSFDGIMALMPLDKSKNYTMLIKINVKTYTDLDNKGEIFEELVAGNVTLLDVYTTLNMDEY